MLGFTYVAGDLLGYGPTAAYLGIVLCYLTMAGGVVWSFGRATGRAAPRT